MLARGKFAVQDEIDLHGMTVAEARPRLADFIDYAAKSGKRCVRVVHGKGLGSGQAGPVLKPAVNRWLRKTGNVGVGIRLGTPGRRRHWCCLRIAARSPLNRRAQNRAEFPQHGCRVTAPHGSSEIQVHTLVRHLEFSSLQVVHP